MTKKTRTDYVTRVKKGIEVYEAMEALEDNANLLIEFGERGQYEIHCSIFSERRSYSIGEHDQLFGRRMNIDMDKSGKSFLLCYSYDLFNNRTTAKLFFEHIKIVEKPEDK